ncbi:hypothetical protein QJS10_CPA09g00728 [Acorus calamus]|uniref:Uncharacterized protein n=1 Tax=Acorus calamus TaxID=4465 RepID=A0AAV9E4E4_ACOCL|nr:hypothetical protein QJS10_CPA09g00728 [Acorus calamus]
MAELHWTVRRLEQATVQGKGKAKVGAVERGSRMKGDGAEVRQVVKSLSARVGGGSQEVRRGGSLGVPIKVFFGSYQGLGYVEGADGEGTLEGPTFRVGLGQLSGSGSAGCSKVCSAGVVLANNHERARLKLFLATEVKRGPVEAQGPLVVRRTGDLESTVERYYKEIERAPAKE